jgi:hypothetical protein
MPYELKDGQGSLFIDEKKKGPDDRDRRGDCKVNGVEYWISGWIRKTKSGEPYLSLSLKPKTATPRPTQERGRQQQRYEEDEF